MSTYRLTHVCNILRTLPSLTDAEIVEEYTRPEMPRPVIKKMVSVGIAGIKTVPVSRKKYRLSADLEIRLLFPCGMGNNAIGTATDEVIAYFTGLNTSNYLVRGITCNETVFDKNAYAVRSAVILHLDYLNELSNSSSAQDPTLSVGNVAFPGLPDSITVTRPDFKEKTDSSGTVTRTVSPREITLKGHSLNSPGSDFYSGLNSLTSSTDTQLLSLPYAGTLNTVCKKLELAFDSAGYGFDYSLVLIEKI